MKINGLKQECGGVAEPELVYWAEFDAYGEYKSQENWKMCSPNPLKALLAPMWKTKYGKARVEQQKLSTGKAQAKALTSINSN